MISEIVKLVPEADRAALNKMFSTLSSRFSQIAKMFGKGLKVAMTAAPFLAIGGAILSKLLNPLQESEEIIDRILQKTGDTEDTAEDLGTTAGNLLRLGFLGEAKGVDADTMKQLLTKFQGALVEERLAAQDPTKQAGTLREFIGEQDSSKAFFNFLQALNNRDLVDRDTAIAAQSEIFGEKLRGRTAQFFNAKPEELQMILDRLPSAGTLQSAFDKAAPVADQNDLLKASRNADDLVTKMNLMDPGKVLGLDASDRQKMRAQNEGLARFDSLKTSSIAIQELTHKIDQYATKLINEGAPLFLKAVQNLEIAITALTPYLDAFKAELYVWYNGISTTVGNIKKAMDQYWIDFKASRLFRLFGGDK